MKQALENLSSGGTFSQVEAKEIFLQITSGNISNEEIAAFLMGLTMRPINVDELLGFREAMIQQALTVDLSEWNTIDIVGTGGDGKNSFNISTCTAIVVAGAGYKVAKHGSYGVSSVSGSANVLQELGLVFSNNENVLKKALDQANICFIHAPLFHPAMKHVVPIRKALKVKTVFNILGPLINPTNSTYGLYGVSSPELADIYSDVFSKTEINYNVVHNMDGYDEISLTDKALTINRLAKMFLNPSSFGLQTISPTSIFGGNTVAEAAEIFSSILENRSSKEQKSVVLANAALAIKTIDDSISLLDAMAIAKESIDSGKAKKSLLNLVSIMN